MVVSLNLSRTTSKTRRPTESSADRQAYRMNDRSKGRMATPDKRRIAAVVALASKATQVVTLTVTGA